MLIHSLQNIRSKIKIIRDFIIKNPSAGEARNYVQDLTEEMNVNIKGHVGYYCAGMNQNANITIEGNVGTGVG